VNGGIILTVQGAEKTKVFAHPLALVEADEIGDRTRVWVFAHLLKGAGIGSDCNIGEHSYIEGSASLGNNGTVKDGVSIWARVTIEDLLLSWSALRVYERHEAARLH